jgi:membrane protein DedA with SNARE-associated domain
VLLPLFNDIAAVMRSDGYLAGPAAMLILLLASVIGPSFFVPAGSLLASAGVLVGAELVSWHIVLWAAAGAAAGTTLSYAAGQALGPRLAHMWPLKERPHLLDRARGLFERHGLVAVVLAYFAGPLHAIVAMVAGAAQMPHMAFQVANCTAALIWTGCYIGLGLMLESSAPAGHPVVLIAPVAAPLVMMAMASLVVMIRRMAIGRAGRR